MAIPDIRSDRWRWASGSWAMAVKISRAASTSGSRVPPVHQQTLCPDVAQYGGPGRMPFRVIRVEEVLRRPAVHGGAELPTEVECVLHPGVHALCAERKVDMGGIARKEHPPVPILLDLP